MLLLLGRCNDLDEQQEDVWVWVTRQGDLGGGGQTCVVNDGGSGGFVFQMVICGRRTTSDGKKVSGYPSGRTRRSTRRMYLAHPSQALAASTGVPDRLEEREEQEEGGGCRKIRSLDDDTVVYWVGPDGGRGLWASGLRRLPVPTSTSKAPLFSCCVLSLPSHDPFTVY